MSIFVFDIETVPDVASGRRIYQLPDLSDEDVAQIMQHKRRQQMGHDFLPLHLHRVVAISVLFSKGDQLKLWSLGNAESPERELIQRCFDGIEKYSPVLVSWNGGSFDLPVLHYRALLHAISAPTYWDTGEFAKESRWNNYIGRYHWRHIDVMDILALYQMRAVAPLQQIATMLGLPGKLGMDGGQVWQCFQGGELDRIRHYCETDVLNTYLVFLRFQLMRGHLDQAAYALKQQQVRDMLKHGEQAHWREFLHAWPEGFAP